MKPHTADRGEPGLSPTSAAASTPSAPLAAPVAVPVGGGPAPFTPDYEYRQDHYLLRFTRTSRDIDAVCRLRYDVFNVELGEGLEGSEATGLDRDDYDDQCQHLMVIDTKANRVVGTYRLQVRESAEAGLGFYSASEFDFTSMSSEMLDASVELGRACTDIKHRTRAVLNLLWRGVITYLEHNRRRYLFGCSSLTSQDPALGLATFDYLQGRGYTHRSLNVQPLASYVCEPSGPATSRVKIPALFALYLRYGVKVCGPPAIDRFFGTIDFLTMLDTDDMDPSVLRSFTK